MHRIVKIIFILTLVFIFQSVAHAYTVNVEPVPKIFHDKYQEFMIFISDSALNVLDKVRSTVEFSEQEPDDFLVTLSNEVLKEFKSIDEKTVYVVTFIALYYSVTEDDENHVYPIFSEVRKLESNLIKEKERFISLEKEMKEFEAWEGYKPRDEFLPIEEERLNHIDLFSRYNIVKGEMLRIEQELEHRKGILSYYLKRRTVFIETLDKCLALIK